MYRRTLSLCGGGQLVPGRGDLSSNRYADQVLRWFTVGSVLRCEKSTPDNNGATKPPDETEDKASSVPPKENASLSPKQENLLRLLSSMKIDVSSKKTFQANKNKKTKQHSEKCEPVESTSRMFQMAADESQLEEKESVSPELAAAASAVASSFPSKKRQVESELLQQLRLHKQMAEAQKKEGHNISKVISGMKVMKQKPKTARQIPYEDKDLMRDTNTKAMAGNVGQRLMIFPVPSVQETPTVTELLSPNLWDLELAKEIASICEQSPRNGFEEMIEWTKEGKLWTFPIDNEVGLDEEQKVEFHEHIFLDKYLEDFPKQGPIRHFMELVTCGLSKNPYLTVQQKKDHIEWFQDYFHQKEELLRESEVYLN